MKIARRRWMVRDVEARFSPRHLRSWSIRTNEEGPPIKIKCSLKFYGACLTISGKPPRSLCIIKRGWKLLFSFLPTDSFNRLPFFHAEIERGFEKGCSVECIKPRKVLQAVFFATKTLLPSSLSLSLCIFMVDF